MSKIEYKVVQLPSNKIIGVRKTRPSIMRMWNLTALSNPRGDYVVIKVTDDVVDLNSLASFLRNPPQAKPEEPRAPRPASNKEVDDMGLTPPFKSDKEAYDAFHDMLNRWEKRGLTNRKKRSRKRNEQNKKRA